MSMIDPLLAAPPAIRIVRVSSSAPSAEECAILRSGLLQALPEVPPKYFYDDVGSHLFERITELGAYYQTRTELQILERSAAAMMQAAAPRHLVELGSGAGRKIRLLLDAFGDGESCTMLDINELFLRHSLTLLQGDYPKLQFRGIVGDFVHDLDQLGPAPQRMVVFFAGTIGNLYPPARQQFMRTLAAAMSGGDSFLVGVDLIKDAARIAAAYNDPEGVTAAFNRNMLAVLNQRFDANFDPEAFAHRAFYDSQSNWIEMRLVATKAQRVELRGINLSLELPAQAELRTEISCKFSRETLTVEAEQAGLQLDGWYSDRESLFALALLRKGVG